VQRHARLGEPGIVPHCARPACHSRRDLGGERFVICCQRRLPFGQFVPGLGEGIVLALDRGEWLDQVDQLSEHLLEPLQRRGRRLSLRDRLRDV
jgi:hypothetical protein